MEEEYINTDITEVVTVDELKWTYDYLLKRYKAGCKYVEENPDKFNQYISKIMEFHSGMDSLLKIIKEKEQVTPEQIIGGFENGREHK